MNVENDIEKCLIARAQMGQPCDKAELKELVREYVVINNISTPFTNNTPGDDWYYLFMKRHPSLSFKKPEQLQKLRKDARKPDIIYDFYDKLQQVYIDNNISDSAFVFNCDESGFQTDPSKLKAIGQKGIALSRISGGSGRESISVLACCAANGIYLPPFIIFKGKGVQARWTSDKSYPGTLYAVSNNGWMEETLFYNWLNTMFVDYINALRKERNMEQQKVVLLFDGHCSHSSLRIVQLAIQNNIILVRFPSHLTDRLQPLDKCVFGPLKTAWNRLLIQFGKDMIGKGAGRLTKGMFSEMLGKLWNNAMNPSNIISGFSTTGLFPFDKYKFPVNEFDPVDLEEYLKCKANEEINDTSVSTIEQPDIIQHNSLDMHAYEVNNNQCFEQSLTPAVVEDQMSLEPSTSSDNISVSSKDIISIFSNQLIQYKTNNTISVTKDRVPRLRAAKYGEVLTTEDVLKRLEEATSKKNLIKYPGKRGRPKKAIEDVENSVVEQLVDDIDDVVYHSSEDDCNDNSLDLSIEEVTYNTPIWSQIKPGVFLLVDFIGGNRKKQHFKYVCLVKRVDEDDGDILVQGLKKYNEIGTDFYIVENDLSDITVEMILAMLPTPTEHQKNRKTIYTFPGYINVNEK